MEQSQDHTPPAPDQPETTTSETPVTPPSPEVTPPVEAPKDSERLGHFKLAFLYTLIAGLAGSAIISIVAILIGEFNEVIQKALLTTFIFMTHSLLILAIVSADTRNQLGRSVVPTVILGTIFANMVTTSFGIWNIWDDEISWRALAFYVLAIGASFLISGVLKLRLSNKLVAGFVNATVVIVTLWSLLLVPWVFIEAELLDEFYFRLVGALTILATTALSLTVIFRRIAISRHADLRATAPAKEDYSPGMLSLVITIGSIVALVWFIGLFVFLISASQAGTY